VSGVLAVEVDDGGVVDASAALAAHLTARGYEARQDGRELLVSLTDDAVYDEIRDGAAELDLALHRLEQRRHGVVELFRTPATDTPATHTSATDTSATDTSATHTPTTETPARTEEARDGAA